MNAAEHVPSSVQLHGYDISDSQFPAQKNWPKNLTFSKMDSLENPPASLVEQYDVVHLRFWCLIVKANDPRPLICHALKLLSMPSQLWSCRWELITITDYRARGVYPMGGLPSEKPHPGR